MRIYPRGRVWYLDYSLGGRRVRRRVGTSKKMAELALKEVELRIVKAQHLGIVEPEKLLFEKLCEKYMDFAKANKAVKSYERDRFSVTRLSKTFAGQLIVEIKAEDLERYKTMRREEVAPATVNRELSLIKHMFNKALQWGYLPENQLRSVMKLREPSGRTRYLDEAEIDLLLRCCAEHIKPIVLMALNTGMRKGEILRLTWAHVDMVNGLITVWASKNNESRQVPINSTLYDILLTLKSNSRADCPVFLGTGGGPVRNLDHAFEGARKRAGLKDFRFHDLRHTFASHLAMKGVDIRTLAQLLGHKTITMTMRYSHLSNRVLREAVNKIKLNGYNRSQLGTNLAQTVAVTPL